MSSISRSSVPAVAIVGMAGRFPGAKDLDTFWQNLRDGVECIESLTDEELLAAGVEPGLIADPNYVKKCTALEDAAMFDALFFGITAREAGILDPQQRIFLECAWEAFEDAGYRPDSYQGLVGVFAGAGLNSYLISNLLRNPRALAAAGGYQTMLGSDKDFLATRVSYKLNLRGPSYTVQSACSTSLVAIQIACQNLLDYECDMALAGGVAVSFPERVGYLHSEGMIFSSDGHCRPFDADATGIRPGAGAGIVLLKRLDDALADRDHIRAVIRGAAINNDGANKMGYTAPGITGQAEVIALAQAKAEIDPDTISYIEAHGTATPLGDPVEIAALTQVFRESTARTQFCRLGSVKSNIGHLDTAAGVAGLIKTVLALEHRQIPPSLHFRRPNPQIDFSNSPFLVNAELTDWPAGGQPRRAGVSSFGIGGTNAHVVLEEAPEPKPSLAQRPFQLLCLSARTGNALETATANLVRALRSEPETTFENAAYTLQVGRKVFDHRRFLVCRDRDEAIAALARRDPARVIQGVAAASRPPVAFLFTGQGSQYPGMGMDSYRHEPTFRKHFDECARLLMPSLGVDIRELVFPAGPGAVPLPGAERLNRTEFTQPALFALEYALARMWMAWGIEPDAMIGHSVGEYVAAALAGVFSLEDALMLVAARGRLMQQLPSGRMVAVAAAEEELLAMLDGALALAAVNGPGACTVSGPDDAMAEFERRLEAAEIQHRSLHTSHAFHSAMMDPILDRFASLVARIRLSPPQRALVSNLTGTWITAAEATDASYWARHLRATVRFHEGVRTVLAKTRPLFLEVGPGRALAGFARQAAAGAKAVSSLPHATDGGNDFEFLMNALGRVWLEGVEPDWKAFHDGEALCRVSLPTYPFERQRYLVEPEKAGPDHAAGILRKNPDLSKWFFVPSWKRSPVISGGAVTAMRSAVSLVFMDDCGFGARIVKRLESAGARCVTVQPGRRFSHTGRGFTIDASAVDDYERLIRELRSSDLMPRRILHLWTVSRATQSAVQSLNLGFHSLWNLAKAVGADQTGEAVRLVVVGNRMQWVTGEERIDPAKGALAGLCRVVSREYPDLDCVSIDIDTEHPAAVTDEIARDILADAAKARNRETVAYRGSQRWIQTYERIPVDAAPDTGRFVRRRGGVVLITGGLGGMGLTFARALALSSQTKLALVSRTPLPPRSDWDRILTSNGVLAARIRAIVDLEALGSEVLPIAADLSRQADVDRLLKVVKQRFGAINGVIHAAGVPGGGLIQTRTREDVERVLGPKVAGTLALYSALKGAALDFFVLCSSVNAIFAGAGAADYCAANAFLDSFAASCHANGDRSVVSINWDTWREVGMAANAEIPALLREAWDANVREGISPAEGVEALRRVLSLSLPQVAVVTRDLIRLLSAADEPLGFAPEEFGHPRRKHQDSDSLEAPHTRPAIASRYVAPQSDIERSMVSIWEEALGIQGVGVEDDFFELGGHSLMAAQLLTHIRRETGIALPVRQLFESRTVAGLSKVVDARRWAARMAATPASDCGQGREEIEV